MNAVTNYETLAGYRRAVSEMYALVLPSGASRKLADSPNPGW